MLSSNDFGPESVSKWCWFHQTRSFIGVKIQTGLDDDNNGVLNATEVDFTSYVCNGAAGSGSLPPSVQALVNSFDIDGDGLLNNADADIVGDFIPNSSDADIDGDGIPNNIECPECLIVFVDPQPNGP